MPKRGKAESDRFVKVAKVFQNGRSQAIRLPAEFRFDCDQVYVRRDPMTNEVILSAKPPSWDAFFAIRDALYDPKEVEGFMEDRDLSPPEDREIF